MEIFVGCLLCCCLHIVMIVICEPAFLWCSRAVERSATKMGEHDPNKSDITCAFINLLPKADLVANLNRDRV